jgi:hypothetical protein
VPKSAIKLHKAKIDDAEHDIEAIEIYVAKQDESSTEQVRYLRGIQGMYRKRIVSQQTEISKFELREQVRTGELPAHLKPRDAVITFQCFSPDFVQVSETIDGENIQHEQVQRCLDVVTEMEIRYMFFAEEADTARKQIMRGRSCVFDVYFREP